MTKENRTLFLIIAILIFANCKTDYQKINVEGFNQAKWENDSLGCNGYREKNYKIIKQYFQENKNFRKEAIIAFLGRSNNQEWNITDDEKLCYFVSKGPQCIGDLRQSMIDAKTTILIFSFNKNNILLDVLSSTP
jgi:hypothetical protein